MRSLQYLMQVVNKSRAKPSKEHEPTIKAGKQAICFICTYVHVNIWLEIKLDGSGRLRVIGIKQIQVQLIQPLVPTKSKRNKLQWPHNAHSMETNISQEQSVHVQTH